MKLQSPIQLRDQKENNNVREMLRTQEIEKAADKARKGLASAEMDFKLTLARNSQEWSEREQAHSKRVVEMESEVRVLEERKKLALLPLKIYEDQAHQILKEAQEYLVEVANKEHAVEELRDLLEDKLDEVGDREQQVRTKEIKLGLQEQGIKEQGEQVSEGIKKLNTQMAEFTLQRAKEEKDIDIRKTALFLAERSVEASRASLKRTEEGLRQWALKLADERETLARAFKKLPE